MSITLKMLIFFELADVFPINPLRCVLLQEKNLIRGGGGEEGLAGRSTAGSHRTCVKSPWNKR